MVLGEVGAEEHASVHSEEELRPVGVIVVPSKERLELGRDEDLLCTNTENVKHQVL
jgi:hypothetical protein